MLRMTNLLLILSLVFAGSWLVAPTLQAAEATQLETVTLDVENMTCNMCPITVRKALEKVPGVIKVEAKYEGDGVGWAKVTFDPARTDIQALTKATADAGYPSSLKTP